MAHLMRARTDAEVPWLQPTRRWSSAAPAPRLSFAPGQTATNHLVSGRCVPSIIVPFVTPDWCEHLEHCHLWARPSTLEHLVFPQAGHTNPCGYASSRSLLSQDSSSGYLPTRSARVPAPTHSLMLLPPACLFAIAVPPLPPSSHGQHGAPGCGQKYVPLCLK
jgi:hypothetical protein